MHIEMVCRVREAVRESTAVKGTALLHSLYPWVLSVQVVHATGVALDCRHNIELTRALDGRFSDAWRVFSRLGDLH